MEQKIKEITEKLTNGTLTKDEADKILLGLLNVINRRKLLLAYSSSKENIHAVRGEFDDDYAVDQWLANNSL